MGQGSARRSRAFFPTRLFCTLQVNNATFPGATLLLAGDPPGSRMQVVEYTKNTLDAIDLTFA